MSSSTIRTLAPSWCSMLTRIDDWCCHEQVSTMRPAKRSTAHASSSWAERDSNSSASSDTSAREMVVVDTSGRLPEVKI